MYAFGADICLLFLFVLMLEDLSNRADEGVCTGRNAQRVREHRTKQGHQYLRQDLVLFTVIKFYCPLLLEEG